MIAHRKRLMTAEEFLQSDHKGLELVDGWVQEKTVGSFSSMAAWWISILLAQRFDWQTYGRFLDAEGGYRCWPDHPDRVRKPDISFVRMERFPKGKFPRGWLTIPPDFAVEVLSANDRIAEVEQKVEEYLEAGVPLIWVVDPEQQELRVYRGSMNFQRLAGDDVVEDAAVLPGFRCMARELFLPESPADE